MIDRIIGLTTLAIVLFLLLNNASSTNSILKGLAEAYSTSVRTLQGR